MGALWLRASAQLRGRALASLLLALLVGVGGALVLAAAAGARRSEAALPRFLAVNRTMDATVYVQTKGPADDLAEERRQLAALPEVRQAFRVSGTVGALILAGIDPTDPIRWHRQIGGVALDPGGSVAFGRPIMVAGRLPDERRPEEVAVDEELAARRHLRVGGRYRVGAFTLEQVGPAGEGRAVAPRGAVADLRVVGIVRYPMDLLPVVTDQDNIFVNTGQLYLTPAYWQRYGPNIANYGIGLAVTLRHGQADLPQLRADLRRLYGGRAVQTTEGLDSGETITAGTRPAACRRHRHQARAGARPGTQRRASPLGDRRGRCRRMRSDRGGHLRRQPAAPARRPTRLRGHLGREGGRLRRPGPG